MLPFSPKRSLGQNFLTSPVVPGWMCDAAAVTPGDVVLEIGPGTGVLTKELLARGAHVVAIEADARALAVLEAEHAKAIAHKHLTLHHLDARTLDLAALGLSPHTFKVVANIPYYLSGFLLRRLLQTTHQPHTIVLLMQKEVVSRIARSEKSSLLSLSVAAFGTPSYVRTVSRGHFQPPPKIDSAILKISDIQFSHFPTAADAEHFFTLLHLGFGQKRKQLISNLSHAYPRDLLTTILTAHNLPLTIRAEDIGVTQWLSLSSALAAIHTLSPTK